MTTINFDHIGFFLLIIGGVIPGLLGILFDFISKSSPKSSLKEYLIVISVCLLPCAGWIMGVTALYYGLKASIYEDHKEFWNKKR